eukprot:15052586-Ditylum_brightwellii.AAC.2
MLTIGLQHCSRKKSILQLTALLLERRVLAQLSLYCDNAAAVLTANSPTRPGLKPIYALITTLQQKLKNTTVVPNLNVSWVKAHQDKGMPIADLTLDAMLNYTADKDAEIFRLTASDELQPKLAPLELPFTKAYLVLNGTVITNNLQQQLEENYKTINIKNTSKRKLA